MRLSDSVEGRLIAAMAIAIVTEQEAIQTLTLLAACLRQPSAMGSELLLAKGFSATGVSSFLRMGKSYETSVTIVHDSMLTDEAAAVLAAADPWRSNTVWLRSGRNVCCWLCSNLDRRLVKSSLRISFRAKNMMSLSHIPESGLSD